MLKSLNDLLVHELQDLYSAEKQLLNYFFNFLEKSTSDTLKNAFRQQLQEIQTHLKRLDNIFKLLDLYPKDAKICRSTKGLLRETDEIINSHGDPDVIDAALVAAARRIQHYKLAGYGTARSYAHTLDKDDIAELLNKNLQENFRTDTRLNKLALGGLLSHRINQTSDQPDPPEPPPQND